MPHTFSQALELLSDYPWIRRPLGDFSFYRSRHLAKLLGNPQNAVPMVHIAGTSGKGSVSTFTEAILRAHGLSTGLHVSPHVYHLLERVQLLGKYVPEELFAHTLLAKVVPAIATLKISPYGESSYYEAILATAWCIFAQQKVDAVVMETGCGGRWDGTNVVTRDDTIAVITHLGMDHTNYLGNTPVEITFQKAGIFQPESIGIAREPEDAASRAMLEETAQDVGASLAFLSPEKHITHIHTSLEGTTFSLEHPNISLPNITLRALGLYQTENASLAILAAQAFIQRHRYTWQEDKARMALAETVVPGRLELHQVRGRTILLDGAHNPQKTTALAESLQNILPPSTKIRLVFACKEGKNAKDLLAPLFPLTGCLYAGVFWQNQDLPIHATQASSIDLAWQEMGGASRGTFYSMQEAITAAMNDSTEGDVIVVAGSLYSLSDAINTIKAL